MDFSPATKRKRDTPEDRKKMAKLTERELHEVTTSNEWPIYNHPEGGTIKITPWGALRQFMVNGEMVTKFEDVTFSDYDFGQLNVQIQQPQLQPQMNHQNEMPTTPMSLSVSNRSSPAPDDIHISPSCEAEGYVVDGYRGDQQFGREQEHFFGMMDQDGED